MLITTVKFGVKTSTESRNIGTMCQECCWLQCRLQQTIHTHLLRTVQVHWVVLYLAADISQTLEDNKLDLVNNMLFKTSTVVKKSPT